MSALNTLCFSGYTLRPATSADRNLAQSWTLADPHHREMNPDFWIEQRLGRDSYLLSDAQGPVFFFKIIRIGDNAVEFHIQFMPETEPEARTRTRKGLVEGLNWIERVLRNSGIAEWSFDSANPELIKFCKKRLGFTGDSGRLRKCFTPAMAAAQ
jgi:hypothetical protein